MVCAHNTATRGPCGRMPASADGRPRSDRSRVISTPVGIEVQLDARYVNKNRVCADEAVLSILITDNREE